MFPFIPFKVWILIFTFGFTILNLNGIKVANRANWILIIIMGLVVFYFMGAAARYVILKNGSGGLFSLRPFYNPESWLAWVLFC